ncbi:hypothetical protein [Streptomyces chryseus]|nr:hypothetical protein [Streptomyces chryseus]
MASGAFGARAAAMRSATCSATLPSGVFAVLVAETAMARRSDGRYAWIAP